jgi:hypothetical protein
MGRGEGSIDKAWGAYAPINKVGGRGGGGGGGGLPRGEARAPEQMRPARARRRAPHLRAPLQRHWPRRPAAGARSSSLPTPHPPQMCDPHGNPNLLTAPADEKWKAIRKGVAVSFAFQNIKRKFPMVVTRVNEVRSYFFPCVLRPRGARLLPCKERAAACPAAPPAWAAEGRSLRAARPLTPRRPSTSAPPKQQLMARMAAQGPDASIDVDQVRPPSDVDQLLFWRLSTASLSAPRRLRAVPQRLKPQQS